MKRLSILLLLIAIHFSSRGQQWAWVTSVSTGSVSVNGPGVLATGSDAVLWAPLLQKNFLYGSEAYGNYMLQEHDTAGNPGTTVNITGRALLIDAQTDAAGNYYILGKVYDSAIFPGGFHAINGSVSPSLSPKPFLCRFDKGTLALNWFKFLGPNDNAFAHAFTVTPGGIYTFVDTSFTDKLLYRYDLATGNSNIILTQKNTGSVTSVQVDDLGNIYVAGGGVSISTADFNGHNITIPVSNPYPAYIVRYKPDGVFDWSIVMRDITLVARQLSLANNNSIYYSGPVNDSFTLDGFSLRHPTWVYDFMVSRLDSMGNVQWVRQMPDTMGGDARVTNAYHAITGNDGSLSVSAAARYYVKWGSGVVTDNGTDDAATVVNYGPNGTVNWALPVRGDYTIPGYIGTDGQNIWFTGSGFDSTALHFGSIDIASAYYNFNSFVAKIRPGLSPVTAVTKPAQALSASIFPNPARDRIYVQSNTATPAMITITDVAGKVMCRKATSGQINESINTSSWPAGIYFAEVMSGGERFVQKVEVVR